MYIIYWQYIYIYTLYSNILNDLCSIFLYNVYCISIKFNNLIYDNYISNILKQYTMYIYIYIYVYKNIM